MARRAPTLPEGEEDVRNPATASGSSSRQDAPQTKADARAEVDELTQLKGERDRLERELQHATGKRIPDLMSKVSKLEKAIRERETLLANRDAEWIAWAKQVLPPEKWKEVEKMLMAGQEDDRQQGSRTETWQLIAEQMDEPDFGAFLKGLVEADPKLTITRGSLPTYREMFDRVRGGSRRRDDDSDEAADEETDETPPSSARGNGSQRPAATAQKPPKVTGGGAPPPTQREPAYKEGDDPMTLLTRGFRDTSSPPRRRRAQ